MTNDNIFSTRDLYLATALVSLGFSTIQTDFQLEGDKTVGYFLFDSTPELEEAQKNYWKGKLLVEPKNYITNMRGLKAVVSNAYKSPHSPFSK